MSKDHPREPNEDAAVPPASSGDAPSPEPDAAPAEPTEDDELEELAEDDEAKPTSTAVPSAAAPTTDGTDSESNIPTTAPLNPFGFGRKSSTPFSGVIPTFGDANALVGKRPFDAKQVASAAAESAQEQDENAKSQPKPRRMVGRARSFLDQAPNRDTEKSPPAEQTKKVAFGSAASPFTFGGGNVAADTKANPFGVSVSFGDNNKPIFGGAQDSKPTAERKDEKPISSNPFVTATQDSAAPNPSPFGSVFGKPAPVNEALTESAKAPTFGSASNPMEEAAPEPAPKPAAYAAPIAPPKSILKKNFMQVPLSSVASMSKPTDSKQTDTAKEMKTTPFTVAAAKPEAKPSIFGSASDKNPKPILFGGPPASADKPSKPPSSSSGMFVASPFVTSSFGTSSAAQSQVKSSASPFATTTPFGTSTTSQPEKKPSSMSPFGSTPFGSSTGFGSFSSQPKITNPVASSSPFGALDTKPFGAFGAEPDNDKPKPTFATSTNPFSTARAPGDAAKSFGSASTASLSDSKPESASLPTVPKLFSLKPPSFGSGSFGSASSPVKKVTTPLFGTALEQAKQNNPVVFSKRPSFQATLSPNAPAFVPGATAHEESSRKSLPFGAPAPDSKSEPMETVKPGVEKPVVGAKPEKSEEKKEEPKPMDTSANQDAKSAVEMDKPAAPEKHKEESEEKEEKEWSHVFTGINLLVFKPSASDSKKGNIQKRDGFYKLEVFKNKQGVRAEVIRLDTAKEEISFSWEVGSDVLKVARIKGRQNHAALTRLGRAVPKEPCENDPVKLFAMFRTSEDCVEFMGVINGVIERAPSVPVAKNSGSEPEATSMPTAKPQPSAPDTNQKSKAADSSAAPVPVVSKESKNSVGSEPEKKDEAAKKENESKMDVDKPDQTSAAPSKLDTKKALAERKKQLLEQMKSRKTASKKSAETQASEQTGKKEGAAPVSGFNPAAKEGDASPKVALSAVVGTKRTAKEALDTETAKKQKVTEEPPKPKAAPEKPLGGEQLEALKNLKKQLALMTEELEKERTKAQSVERSLRAEVARKNGEVRKLQSETKTLGENVKDAKKQREMVNNAAYELAGLTEEMNKLLEDKAPEHDKEALFACRPQSREDFFKRLWTFQPDTWIAFSEVGVLDPVECALYGWHNEGVNRLASSGGATVEIDEAKFLDVKLYEAEVRRVRKAITGGAHPLLGGWRGNPCPDYFRTALLNSEEKTYTKQRKHGVVELTCKWCKRRTVVTEGNATADKVQRYRHCPMAQK